MALRRVLMVTVIFLAAMVVLYLSGAHRQHSQTRVYIAKMWNRPEAEAGQATKYFREACPDLVVTHDHRRADYTIGAVWTEKWIVMVDREGLRFPFFYKADSPDALESFRQSCAAMREDAKDREDFDSHAESRPVGRYLLQSPTPDRVFLLDTRTGAVWHMKQNPLEDRPEFDRIPVEGLYQGYPRLERPPKSP